MLVTTETSAARLLLQGCRASVAMRAALDLVQRRRHCLGVIGQAMSACLDVASPQVGGRRPAHQHALCCRRGAQVEPSQTDERVKMLSSS